MLLGVHHAGVTVADLDRSLAFYRDVLGLELYAEAERSDEMRDPDGDTVELFQPPER